jgi:hypothetical protein
MKMVTILTEPGGSTMQTDSAAAAGSDPLTAIADAMDAAVEAAKGGTDRVRATVAELVPAAGRFLSRAVYRTSYAVSFGVVFPAMMIANAIPKSNAVVHGLVDGALAARDAVQDQKAGAELEAAPDAG